MESKLLNQIKDLTLELYNVEKKRKTLRAQIRDIEILVAGYREAIKEQKETNVESSS